MLVEAPGGLLLVRDDQGQVVPAASWNWTGAEFMPDALDLLRWLEVEQDKRILAFDTLRLSELVSFTVPANVRSRAVMERIGMRHCPDEDFLHPLIPPGHRLRRHVLYRLEADALACGTR